MKKTNIISAAIVLTGLCFTAAMLAALIVIDRTQPEPALGSAMENTFNDIPTATNVNVGEDVSTLVVATNTARQYLRITNNGTTSPQALFCNTNDRAATKNSGFAVYASSSIEFKLDNLYRGALRCIYDIATSSVTVVEK